MNFVCAGGLLFAAGDYCGLRFVLPLAVWGILSAAAAIVLCWLYYRKENAKSYQAAALLLLFFFGGLLGANAQVLSRQHVANYTGRQLEVVGTIVPGSIKMPDADYLSFELAVESAVAENNTFRSKGNIRVGVVKYAATDKFPNYGRLAVRGKLRALSSVSNPGSYDNELACRVRDLGGRMTVKSRDIRVLAYRRGWRDYLTDLSYSMKQKLKKVMSPRDSAILSGMVLGGYDSIDADTVRGFAATGLVHILSVSGSHIALLIGFVLSAGRLLRFSKSMSTGLSVFLVLVYAFLCGFSPPVVRSVIMGLGMLGGMQLERESDRGAILAGMVLLMLCYKPLWLLDVGFQLSVLATGGLIFLLPTINALLASRLPRFIAESLSVCLAAQLLVLPFLVHYFHYISLSSLAANLLVLPIIEAILLITLSGLAISFVVPIAGNWVLIAAAALLWPALELTEFIGAWKWGTVQLQQLPYFTAWVYYGLVGLSFSFYPFNNLTEQRRRIGMVLCSGVITLTFIIQVFMPQPFTVYFLDVGQGDCALVFTPAKETILIDTGGLSGGFDTGERIIMPFLRYLGIKKLDLMLLSHGHHDHAGGAAMLAKLIPIHNVRLPQEKYEEDINKLLHNLTSKTDCRQMHSGDYYRFKDCLVEIIYAPEQEADVRSGNESSVIMRVSSKSGSILFTGDATGEQEAAVSTLAIKADVLKVSHHGSASSSIEEFLCSVRPQTAVISVGSGNRYGHPSPEVLERLRGVGAKVFRTDEMGAIKVVFKEHGHRVYGFRREPQYF